MFIPHYEKIIFIRNYLKSNKVKLFLGKNLYKIAYVNLSIYFISKSFIYYKKKNLNKNFSELLMGTFLPWLSDDIYNLYTQKSRFYGNELCKSFPLYYFVKSFIETNIIPDKNFTKYLDYINNEMPMELKDENNLESSYSSRLTKNKNKKGMKKRNSIDENDLEGKNSISPIDNNKNQIYQVPNAKTSYSTKNVGVNDSSLNFIINMEKPFLNIFSNFKNTRNIIFNGKKYFLKNIFAESFKDLLYNDNNFKKIKLTFLIKHRQYKNIDIDTKQFNYPSAQKNFSNSVSQKYFIKEILICIINFI